MDFSNPCLLVFKVYHFLFDQSESQFELSCYLQVDEESEDLLDSPQPGSLLEVLSILRNLIENITKRQQSAVSSVFMNYTNSFK